MECTSPNIQYWSDSRRRECFGKLKFWKPIYGSIIRKLPCKKCINCYVTLAQQKAIRSVHESLCYDKNIFATLTYANNDDIYLDYSHVQHFKMRMRTDLARLGRPIPRFFHVGEYGEESARKHWHFIIFNYHPDDYRDYKKTPEGHQLYISGELDDYWTHGYCNFGEVNYDTASYVAKYQLKTFLDPNNPDALLESIKKGMPNRPALGIPWLVNNWSDVFNKGYVMYYDQKIPIPDAYVDWLEKNQPDAWVEHKTKRNYEEVFKNELDDYLIRTVHDRRAVNSRLYKTDYELKELYSQQQHNVNKGNL